jgi:hypothetical protein
MVFPAPYDAGLATSWWLGASDAAKEGQFVWCYPNSEGVAITYSSWVTWTGGQPDNAGNNENCVQNIVSEATPPNNIRLNDLPCGHSLRFICEVNLSLRNYDKRF